MISHVVVEAAAAAGGDGAERVAGTDAVAGGVEVEKVWCYWW